MWSCSTVFSIKRTI
jgi:hypothetical protein